MSATTLCPDVRIVPDQVARNPVARAIAKAQMAQAVRDFATRIYLMHDGEDARLDGTASARVLAIGIRLAEQRGDQDKPACRVMRGGMETVVGLATRQWRWRTADAAALDVALQHALATVQRASAIDMQRAWRFVHQLEQDVAARAAHPQPKEHL